MPKLHPNSMEEDRLFQLMGLIEVSTSIEQTDLMLITILINTTEKLEAFQAWIESKMDEDTLTVDAIDVMNQVSRINRMY